MRPPRDRLPGDVRAPLRRADLHEEPSRLFDAWFAGAREAGVRDPHAMALATIDADGRPGCRMVLMRGCDRRGIVFYTNFDSRKGRALAAEPRAAVTFWWPPLQRQVRIEGEVERVPDGEADAYFGSRPRASQLSAWASPQSAEIADRGDLDRRIDEVEQRFAGREDVPRPPNWGGFRLVPHRWEFWQDGAGRAHDRFRYERAADGAWRIARLAP